MSVLRRASTLKKSTLPGLHEHNAPFYADSLTGAEDKKKIRLLQVHPAGSFEDLLVCDLVTVPLDGEVQYIALSYSWGEYKKSYKIRLTGKDDFWVTESAFDAIRRFRALCYKDVLMPKTLWIDAVCINQHDIPERNAQVTIMGDIYESAKQVLVWLGPCSGEDHGPSTATCQQKEAHSSGNIVRSLAKHVANPAEPMPSILKFNEDGVTRWWRRCWTFQEAFLAKDIGFMIGPHYYSFAEILCFDRSFVTSQTLFPKTFSEVLSALTVRDLHLGSALYDLLSINNDRNATNPKDKIYSILPLYKGPHECCKNLTVDYARRIEDIVCDVVVEFLREGRTLDDMASIWPCPPAPWPSWLPDLTGQVVIEVEELASEAEDAEAAQAEAWMEYNVEDNPVLSSGPRLVRTEGFALIDEALYIDEIIISISADSIAGPLRERDRSRKWKAEANHRLAASLVQLIKERWENAGLDRRAQKNRPTPEWQLIRHALDNEPGAPQKKRATRNKLGTSSICDWKSLVLQVQNGFDLFVTSRGFVGLAPARIKVEDVVVFPTVCSRARVLRPENVSTSTTDGSYRIVGACWMPSIQTGVIRDLFTKEKLAQRTFKII